MKVATSFTSETPTIAERLRQELTTNERQIVIMQDTPDGAIDVIQRMDHIDTLLMELRETRYDARAEESRTSALRERLRTRDAAKAAKLVRASGHAAQLADSPTWQAIAAKDAALRAARNRRLLIGGAGLATVALLLFVVIPWAFPAPPQANLNQMQQLLSDGKPDAALAEAQAEYARVPSDPTPLLWIGALQQQRGDTAAQATWEQARKQYDDDPSFFTDRSITRLQFRDFAGAEADARALLDTPRTAPQGQYLLGQIYEAQDKRDESMAAYQEAARLAEAQNNAQLTVAARTRMGFLMQRPPMPTP